MSRSALSSSSIQDVNVLRRPLRRLTLELFVVIALKIALLMLIWWLLFAPQPKPDTSPDAMARRLAPAAPTPPAGHP
jgi:hypothetical protein